VLCADDFAFTEGVSRGILRLLEAGRLSATGAMTNRPHWRRFARELAAFADHADIGVHLNLTGGVPLAPMPRFAGGGTFPRLEEVLRAGLVRRLPEGEIAAEIERQLDAFEQEFGRAPDFIDGHQHVHVLGGVRQPLLSVLKRRYTGPRPYLRNPFERPSAIAARRRHIGKALTIAWFARDFGEAANAAGFARNKGFAGVSDFDPTEDYAEDFARYLVAPGPRHLVMCHPGLVDDELRALDPAVESRQRELDFFLSPRFPELCSAAGLTRGRFSAFAEVA